MRAEIVLITPELANAFLESNSGNRRLRAWWVEALAAAMRRGEWRPTHQGIALSENGRLMDGQHRLAAIAKCGIAQHMLLVGGIPDDAFAVLDIGIKRSIADTTGLSKKTAEACRYAATIMLGGTVTPQQVLQVANGGLGEVHESLLETCNSSARLYTAAPMRVAACIQIMDGHQKAYVFDLYRRLALQHFEELPPIGYAFVRQAGTGKIDAASGAKGELLARALKLFNHDYKNITRIQLGEGDASAATAMVRTILQRSITPDAKKGGTQ